MQVLDNPAALRAALRGLAGNLWFTWLPGARALFEELGRERFAAVDHNPTALLADLDDDALAAAATPAYVERVQRALAELQAERERRTWWQRPEFWWKSPRTEFAGAASKVSHLASPIRTQW